MMNVQKYDAVAGDVTIVANRSEYVDFTLPYTESGVAMVVPVRDDKSKNAWVFLKPLSWEMWLMSFCSFVFIGFLVWVLEHDVNDEINNGSFWNKVGIVLWFAFSTMVFAHSKPCLPSCLLLKYINNIMKNNNKERVVSNLTRMVLILTQSYTASLASMLTVQKLQPTVTDVNLLIKNNDYVWYMQGSFVYGLLKKMKFDEYDSRRNSTSFSITVARSPKSQLLFMRFPT